MTKRRYVAPARGALASGVFDHPIFAGYAAHRGWLDGDDWPDIAQLDAIHAARGHGERFRVQDDALLGDGLHYEERIARHGVVATRAQDWHDLFNALVWIEHAPIKRALNRRQVQDIARAGPRERTRAQCALTHFDEAGAIVLLHDPELLALWDAHDWHGLFWRERAAWRDGRLGVVVFGHALLEHMLTPGQYATAKCLAVCADGHDDALALACVAENIAEGRMLCDPQELRPLPLSGIPGWHGGTDDEAFYRSAPCFRPLREGRRYPAPLRVGAGRSRECDCECDRAAHHLGTSHAAATPQS